MENKEVIKDYIINDNNFDIDGLITRYYNYVYTIVMNFKNINISQEDIEEIISDIFMAVWNNKEKIKNDVIITHYLAGITKNIVCKKYRDIKLTYPIDDYEESFADIINVDKIVELKEQNDIIKRTLKNMRKQEYKIFIMFYYEGRKINEISKILKISISKVKVTLHRIRKKIKKSLKEGGYDYE